jgi:predicted amidohydrolase YtcJ
MDLVLLGGNVLTMDIRNTRAEAVAVDNGRIVAIEASDAFPECQASGLLGGHVPGP